MKKLWIVGYSGFAKEVYALCKELEQNKELQVMGFVDKAEEHKKYTYLLGYYDNLPIYNDILFDFKNTEVVIAVGNPKLRKRIYADLFVKSNGNIKFPNIISPRTDIMNVTIEENYGIVICSGCILTCDIKLGKFVQLNLGTTIGHNSVLGDFTTTAPLVSINGNVNVGENVYFGTHSCTIEKLNIVSNVIIGAGSVVIRDINEPGTYVGSPCRKVN